MKDHNNVLMKLSEHKASRFWKVDYEELTEAERVFRLIWELESEVNNGGFGQYYYNFNGDLAHHCPGALRIIGATQAAQIVENANNRFPGGSPPTDQAERHSFLKTISNDMFDDLDKQFFEYPDDLTELLYSYVMAYQSDIAGAAEALSEDESLEPIKDKAGKSIWSKFWRGLFKR